MEGALRSVSGAPRPVASKRLRLRARYRRWVLRYRAYARMRGFTMEFNGPAYHIRGFLLCWAEPGFHRFWQVWNPGIAYFTWRLYRRLGRRIPHDLRVVLTFLVNALIHTAVFFLISLRFSWVIIVAFTLFGIGSAVSQRAAPLLRFESWPRVLNAVINIGLVIAGLDIGFRLNRLLM